MQISKLTTIAFSTAFLMACGGGGGGGNDGSAAVGGGGGGGNDGSASVTATAALTSANQDIAVQETVSTALMPVEFAQSFAQALTGSQTTDESGLFKFAFAQKKKLPTYLLNASKNSTLIGAEESFTEFCAGGGSLTVSASVANANGDPSAGDSATITANNCVEDDGTINGSLGLRINSLSGDLDSDYYNVGITFSFNNLTLASPQYIVRVNGSMALAGTAEGPNNLIQTYSSPSLSVSATYDGETHTRTLSSYQVTVTVQYDSTSYRLRGAVTSSALSSQKVTFDTITPFIQLPSDVYASSGVLMITGAANTHIRLTAINDLQVRQELDANGDGTFEESKEVYWYSLL